VVEVFAVNSRFCDPDPWDGEIAEYPGPNEEGCVESSCTFTFDSLDSRTSPGNLCFWDRQDWFRFDVTGDLDHRILLEYNISRGRMSADLTRRDGAEVFSGSGVFSQRLLERTSPRTLPNGADYTFNNYWDGNQRLRSGMHEIGVIMALGTSPNDYILSIDRRASTCLDGSWSNAEECDWSGGVSDAQMCSEANDDWSGSGTVCSSDCVCE
jgi:hypothetical protein